jgi:plasmid stabilization system protein ParE
VQLKVSKRARMNLRQIGHYYLKTGGLVLAETMLDRIESRFDQLLNFPYSAPVYPYKPNLRCLIVADGLFIVFYRIERSVIAIIHIRRAEQDLL